jgi:hypothetical protein
VSGFRTFLIASLATALGLLHAQQAPDAAGVLAAAREALGGDKKLAAVTTVIATGRTRQIRGNNLVPIEFEINCELPVRCVRKDEIPAQDTDVSVVQLFIQAQNLTNQRNYLGYSGTQTSPFFGRPTSVSPMRRIDAGISLQF